MTPAVDQLGRRFDGASVVGRLRTDDRRPAQATTNGDWRGALGCGVVAQLTVVVVAPAPGGAGAGEPAGVVNAGGDRGERHPSLMHCHWDVLIGRGVVAQLAVHVPTPAVGGACAGEPAGVPAARRNRGERHTALLHRYGGVPF